MYFSRPIQWYHSHADPIWPNGKFKETVSSNGFDFCLHEKIEIRKNKRCGWFFIF